MALSGKLNGNTFVVTGPLKSGMKLPLTDSDKARLKSDAVDYTLEKTNWTAASCNFESDMKFTADGFTATVHNEGKRVGPATNAAGRNAALIAELEKTARSPRREVANDAIRRLAQLRKGQA